MDPLFTYAQLDFKMLIGLKITLAVFFFLCLLNMPYGYYQLIRFIALVGFAMLAYNTNEQGQRTETVIYVCLAILFQPFIKIALGKRLWNTVDLVVGIGLIASFFLKKKAK